MNLDVVIKGEGGTIEETVDADIREFDEFFRSLGNDPVTRPEKSIIKTWVAWKLGLMKKK